MAVFRIGIKITAGVGPLQCHVDRVGLILTTIARIWGLTAKRRNGVIDTARAPAACYAYTPLRNVRVVCPT